MVRQKFIIFSFLLLSCSLQVLGQQQIQGIVFDTETKQRIARVFVYNAENDEGGFNNTKGEFSIIAKPGDVLIAASEGYFADTLIVNDKKTMIFNLKRSAIRIQEVSVIVRRNPEEVLKEKQREYSSIYSRGSGGSLLSAGPTGSGLNIDAIYKLISRDGKNARRLQEIIERDYRESVIDYRFNPELVAQTTGLKNQELTDFMIQFRPSYYFVLASNDYNLIIYIKSSYARFLQDSVSRRAPALPKNK